MEVVKGLHGLNYVLHAVVADADRLIKWCSKFSSQFEVDRREERRAALRYRVDPPQDLSSGRLQ